jgi:hypothetical protein
VVAGSWQGWYGFGRGVGWRARNQATGRSLGEVSKATLGPRLGQDRHRIGDPANVARRSMAARGFTDQVLHPKATMAVETVSPVGTVGMELASKVSTLRSV